MKKMQFNEHVYETTLGGRKLVIETGKLAQLSNGSCMVRYGDTAVLVNVTASPKPREGVDFFPMSVASLCRWACTRQFSASRGASF